MVHGAAGAFKLGIAERRERERQDVRRRILDAARDLFMREGYERVTMRRIADAIEYSPTTIYLHFEDKDALVNALCAEEFQQLLDAFAAAPPPADPVDGIRQLGLAYARFGLQNPYHYRFMFMTPIHSDHEVSAPGAEAYRMLRRQVEGAVAAGMFVDLPVDTIAQVLWASLHGAVSLLITYRPDQFPHAPAAADLLEQTMQNTVRGLLRRP
jgi:AcrR family transcriptional regulator